MAKEVIIFSFFNKFYTSFHVNECCCGVRLVDLQVLLMEKTGELEIDGKGTGIFPAKDAAKLLSKQKVDIGTL